MENGDHGVLWGGDLLFEFLVGSWCDAERLSK